MQQEKRLKFQRKPRGINTLAHCYGKGRCEKPECMDPNQIHPHVSSYSAANYRPQNTKGKKMIRDHCSGSLTRLECLIILRELIPDGRNGHTSRLTTTHIPHPSTALPPPRQNHHSPRRQNHHIPQRARTPKAAASAPAPHGSARPYPPPSASS